MEAERSTGLTYGDLLERFPEEDNVRRELVDGELIVPPSPSVRHQEVVLELGARLLAHAKRHGGRVFANPLDLYLSETNVPQPDVLFVRPEHAGRVEERLVRGAPDLVVEVSSPSTRRLDLTRKRELYETSGIPEYWFVDLDADRVEVYRLRGGAYGGPTMLGRGDVLESPSLPGLALEVNDLLGDPS